MSLHLPHPSLRLRRNSKGSVNQRVREMDVTGRSRTIERLITKRKFWMSISVSTGRIPSVKEERKVSTNTETCEHVRQKGSN